MLIRSLIVLGIGSLAMGCTTAANNQTDCGGAPCAAIGEPFDSGEARITVIEVLEDSRCPVDAQCIQAGQVRVRALVQRGPREGEVELATGKPAHILSGTLSLTQVWPEASLEHPIDDAQAYRFAFTWVPHMLDRPD